MARIAGKLASKVRVLATLGLGACAGAALTAQLGAKAEDGSAAALAALESRIAALEAANEKPEFKAPFQVLGSTGKPIFSVTEGYGGATLVVGTDDSSLITLDTTDNELELSLAKGDNVISLTTASDGSTVKISGSGGMVEVKGGDAPSLAMTQGDEAIFKVDTAKGGPELTLQKASQSVRLGTLPNQTGVFVDSSSTHFQMGDIENIRGFVASRGDLPFAGLGAFGDDKYRVVIYNGGTTPVFLGGFDRETGRPGMWVGNESGTNVASIVTADGGGAGELKLSPPGGQPLVTLGPAEGGGGASLKLGAGEDGLTASTTGSTATVIAKVGGKVTEMGVTAKSTGFVVGGDEKPLAALADNGDNKPFLNIYGNGVPQPVITLGTASGSPVLRVFDKSGGLAVVAGAVEDGRGAVKVYEANRIMAGMEADGGGNSSVYVTVNENDVAGLYNRDGKGEIRVNSSGRQLVKIGTIGSQGMLELSDGSKPTVSLGPTDKNPNVAVRVFGKSGMVFAAGATTSGEGAAVVLAGGKLRAGMEAQGNNGKVYVLTGDQEVASINSTDKSGEGMVVVRNTSGVAVAKLSYGSSGGGNVQTTNPAGEGVFSAGYASDGAGEACVYRLTQAGSGRMGCIGLALPSAGMGK